MQQQARRQRPAPGLCTSPDLPESHLWPMALQRRLNAVGQTLIFMARRRPPHPAMTESEEVMPWRPLFYLNPLNS